MTFHVAKLNGAGGGQETSILLLVDSNDFATIIFPIGTPRNYSMLSFQHRLYTFQPLSLSLSHCYDPMVIFYHVLRQRVLLLVHVSMVSLWFQVGFSDGSGQSYSLLPGANTTNSFNFSYYYLDSGICTCGVYIYIILT